MYGVSAYFLSKTLISILVFLIYPILVSLAMVFLIGLQTLSFLVVLKWFAILLSITLLGNGFGIMWGAIFKTPEIAMQVNTTCLLMFQLGAGLYVNIGSASTNPLMRVLSTISPLNYGCDLIFNMLLDGNNPIVVEGIRE